MAASAAQTTQQDSLLLRHMPSIDSLRGLAVLMVVLFHGLASWPWTHSFGPFWGPLTQETIAAGRFGVNVFFVISGFLITGILLNTRDRPGFYKTFYRHRALRILPVYLLTLLVLLLLHVIEWRFALAALLFIPNFSRVLGAPLTEYGVLWTLGVEEQFYLLWPTCVRRLRERTLLRLLVVLLAAEPLLRLAAALLSAHIDIHYKTPFVLDFLAYGALLALLVRSRALHAGNAARIGTGLLASGGVLAAAAIAGFAFHDGTVVQALGDLPFAWGACGALLLGLGRDHRRAARTPGTAARGFLDGYGDISYGLYLIHLEVYTLAKSFVVRRYGAARLDDPGFYFPAIVACIAVSTVLAYLSRRFFEERFLRLKTRPV